MHDFKYPVIFTGLAAMLITKSPNYEHMHLIWQQTPSHSSSELLQLAIPSDPYRALF